MYKYIITIKNIKKGRDAYDKNCTSKWYFKEKPWAVHKWAQDVHQSEIVWQAHYLRRYVLDSQRTFAQAGKLTKAIGSVLYFLQHTFFI